MSTGPTAPTRRHEPGEPDTLHVVRHLIRLPLASIAVAAALALAACSGGPGSSPTAGPASPSPDGSAAGRPSVLPVVVSSEIAVGENRILFSFLDASGNRPVAAPDRTASVRFTGPEGAVVDAGEGTFVWAIEDVRGVYVVHADFPAAGPWQAEFTTAAPNSPEETIRFQFDVRAERSAIAVGEQAPSVRTPTADDVDGDLSRISTDAEPVPAFYELSVDEALEAGRPFILAFATPKFCATAQCGPTLDRLKPIAAAHPEIAVINVEPYELRYEDEDGLQPVLTDGGQLSPVESVTAYGILSEPYLFLVDGEGVVRASFEAIFSEQELEEAIDALG